MIGEPGDDKYDVADGSAGVCTDVRVGYGATQGARRHRRQGAEPRGVHGRATGWSQNFAGALVETTDSDFVTGVSIAESSLEYPRTLVPETQVNGKTERRSPTVRRGLREEVRVLLVQRARRPAEPTCALCEPPCRTTWRRRPWSGHRRPARHRALQLNAICQNSLAACAAGTDDAEAGVARQPRVARREVLVGVGRVSLIMDRIVVDNIRQAEPGQRTDRRRQQDLWVDRGDRPRVAEYKTFKRCPEDPEALAALFGCQPGAEPAAPAVLSRAVCLGKTGTYNDYKTSTPPSASELEQRLPTSWATRTRACRPR